VDNSGIAYDTSYVYQIIPYNKAGVAGASYTTVTAYTAGYVSDCSLVVDGLTVSGTVYGAFDGFTWTNLTTHTSNRVAVGITSFIDTSGIAYDASYVYQITPYNKLGVAGASYTTIASYTAGYITDCTFIFTGLFISSTVYGAFDGFTWMNMVTGTSDTVPVGITSFVDNSGIAYDTSYVYQIIPYNKAGVAGASYTTITAYTAGYVSDCSLVVDGLILSGTVYGAFDGFTWMNTVTGTSDTVPVGSTTFVDSSGIAYDTSYVYQILPFNTVGDAGISYTTVVAYTDGVVVDCSFIVDGLTISGTVYGAFDGFTWMNTVTGTSDTVPVGSTTFVDSSGIAYDTLYVYQITPYNNIGIAGASYTTQSIIIPST
jgi:hypothetical protein